MFAFFR